MAISDAKKKANAEWNKKNITTIGCSVRKEQAEKFKEYARAKDKTPNTVLKEYILDCIGESPTDN